MSRRDDLHEGSRWLDTGAEDLRAARVLMAAGLHARACFAAQQCAEKAVKGVWYACGEDPWGHSIQKLIIDCSALRERTDIDVWRERAGGLDRYYIATRYPNGLPDLTPEQSYFRADADDAIVQAEWILDQCRGIHAALEKETEAEDGVTASPDDGGESE